MIGYAIFAVFFIVFFWLIWKIGGPGPNHCSKCAEYYKKCPKCGCEEGDCPYCEDGCEKYV